MKQQMLFDIRAFANQTTFTDICRSLDCNGEKPAWPDMFGQALANFLNQKKIRKIRTLSLFSGAGGLDVGFSDVGFEIIESVEIEKQFCETLERNSGKGKFFKNSKVNCIDIREFSGRGLGKIDFIIGGPPCQTFSAAGRRANGVLGTTDARGILFREYVRLLAELSPVGFLFENVYGIVGAQDGQPWREILDSFAEVGYNLFYRVVDAADYGVPQHRERLLIVGLKEGKFEFPRPTHGPDSLDKQPFYNAKTAVEGVKLNEEEARSGISGRYGKLLDDIPPGLNYSFYTEEMGHPQPIFAWRSKFSDFLYKADPDTPVRTIKASGGACTGPFHWDNRFFSLKEYKRLQTFPDAYEISGSKQAAVKQIGNSVPPQLARIMAVAIRRQVFDTDWPFTLSTLADNEELSFRKRKRELTECYRKKAKTAIAALSVERMGFRKDSYRYWAEMTKNFAFTETTVEARYCVSVVWSDVLKIEIDDNKRKKRGKISAKIEIFPREQPWGLGVTKTEIEIYSDEVDAFTVAWKAFERELTTRSIKADIVQLNGYYQYSPRLRCVCEFYGEFPYKEIVEQITTGVGVAQLIDENFWNNRWGTANNEIIQVAEFLRRLGYEVRNNKTNPQIESGYWLIPYSFPTLTPKSVQLRKSLR